MFSFHGEPRLFGMTLIVGNKEILIDYAEEPNPNLECSICKRPFWDPVTVHRCGHTFCRACLDLAVRAHAQCPIDRRPIDISEDAYGRANCIIRNMVDELRVYCWNRACGCDEVLVRSQMSVHVCPFENVKCPNIGCDEYIQKRDLDAHMKLCEFGNAKCDSCGLEMLRQYAKEHNCADSVRTSCRHCRSELEASHLQDHISLCLEVPVICPETSMGCEWRGRRSQLARHETQCPVSRTRRSVQDQLRAVQLSNETLTNQVNYLTDRLEQLEINFMAPPSEGDVSALQELRGENAKLRADLKYLKSSVVSMESTQSMNLLSESFRLREEMQSLQSLMRQVQFQHAHMPTSTMTSSSNANTQTGTSNRATGEGSSSMMRIGKL